MFPAIKINYFYLFGQLYIIPGSSSASLCYKTDCASEINRAFHNKLRNYDSVHMLAFISLNIYGELIKLVMKDDVEFDSERVR